MGLGSRNATNGRDYKASSWSRASAKSPDQAPRPTNSSVRRASTLLHCCGSPPNSGRLSELMVENGLHWVMDVTFRDDQCRIRTDHAPANFTTIKHMALNLIRRARGKDSLRLRRKVAAWDDDFLASLIAA